MDLRQIRYFVAIVETGSMLAAARRLNMAQPALSRRIRDLEAALGTRLLSRHSRGAALTTDGSRFLGHAREILAAVGRAERAFGVAGETSPRRLSFGVTPTPSITLMPQIVSACGALEPPVSLLVRQGSTPELLDLLARRTIDGALSFARPSAETAFAVQPLLCEDLVLLGLPALLGSGDEIAFRQLPGYKIILDPATHVGRQLIDRTAEHVGTSLDVRAEIEPRAVKLAMMLSEDVVAIAMASAFAAEIAGGVLIARRIVRPALTMTLHLIVQNSVSAPVRSSLMAVAADTVRQATASGAFTWRKPPRA